MTRPRVSTLAKHIVLLSAGAGLLLGIAVAAIATLGLVLSLIGWVVAPLLGAAFLGEFAEWEPVSRTATWAVGGGVIAAISSLALIALGAWPRRDDSSVDVHVEPEHEARSRGAGTS